MDINSKKVMYDKLNMIYVEVPKLKKKKVEQDKYHKNLKVYRDLFNSFETAHNTGDKKGFKRGKKEGIEEGMEQGIEQGKLREKLEIAKNLLDVLDNETIALKTGLNIEEIEHLR